MRAGLHVEGSDFFQTKRTTMKFTRPGGLSHTDVGTARQTGTANIPNAMKHRPRLRPPRCGVQNCTFRKVLEYLPQSTLSDCARRIPVLPSAAPCVARPSDCWSMLLPPCRQVQSAAFLALAPRRGGHRLHHFHRPKIYTLRHKDTMARTTRTVERDAANA